jgi:hypothetical protein
MEQCGVDIIIATVAGGLEPNNAQSPLYVRMHCKYACNTRKKTKNAI